MRKILAVVAMLVATPAVAGDFSGPYIGFDFGKRFGVAANAPTVGPFRGDAMAQGLSVGAFGGWAFRSGNVVYGAELGAEMIRSGSSYDPSFGNPWIQRGSAFNSEVKFVATAKARLGYDFSGTLVAVAAGIGAANVGSLYNIQPCVPGVLCVRDRFNGFRRAIVFDAMAEREIADGVRVRAGYSAMRLGTQTDVMSTRTPMRGDYFDQSMKIGLVFSLSPSAPK